MNRDKWKTAPTSRLVIKLSEEVGEVAKAYLEAVEATNDGVRDRAKVMMLAELRQVAFIHNVLVNRIETSAPGFMDVVREEDDDA